MGECNDEVAQWFRKLLDRRQFVDREPGILLIWLAAERQELAEMIPQIEARHPGARFNVQNSGSAIAVQVTARDNDLAAIEELYIDSQLDTR